MVIVFPDSESCAPCFGLGWVPDDPKQRQVALARCAVRASYTFSIGVFTRGPGVGGRCGVGVGWSVAHDSIPN